MAHHRTKGIPADRIPYLPAPHPKLKRSERLRIRIGLGPVPHTAIGRMLYEELFNRLAKR